MLKLRLFDLHQLSQETKLRHKSQLDVLSPSQLGL